MRHLVILILLSSTLTLHAQNEGAIWYFGENLGVDFTGGQEKELFDGQTNTASGTSVLCSPEGELQLYTDGQTIWNADHKVVEGGTGLYSYGQDNLWFPQGTMIVKQPHTGLIYVFSLGGINHLGGGVYVHDPDKPGGYTIVDLSLNNGKGKVIEKNVRIDNERSWYGGIVARHLNTNETLIILLDLGNEEIVFYILDKNGLRFSNAHPLNVPISQFSAASNPYMALSRNGKYLGIRIKSSISFLQDDATMIFHLEDDKVLNVSFIDSFLITGWEFSPNERFLYVNGTIMTPSQSFIHGLFQIEVDSIRSMSMAKIPHRLISNIPPTGNQLRMTPNGQIFMTTLINTDPNISNLSGDSAYQYAFNAILSPDSFGANCEYTTAYLKLSKYYKNTSSMDRFSLPNTCLNYFFQPYLDLQEDCVNKNLGFKIHRFYGDSISWDFSDGYATTTKSDSITRSFLTSGEKWVRAIIHNKYGPNDTLSKNFKIHHIDYQAPKKHILICEGEQTSINLNVPEDIDYSLNINDSAGYLKITGTHKDTIFIRLENDYCSLEDSIVIVPVNCKLSFSDSCLGDTVKIAINSYADSIQWSINEEPTTTTHSSSELSYFFSSTGKKVIKACFFLKGDSICRTEELIIPSLPKSFIQDTIRSCSVFLLKPDLPDSIDQYKWSTGSTELDIQLTETGTYVLTIQAKGCQYSDTTYFEVKNCDCSVYIPTAFSPNNDGLNDGFHLQSECPVEELEARIYSRWGELLYMSQSKDGKIWDGQIAHQPAPEGVYFYTLSFMNNGSRVHEFGTVHLLR